MTNFLNTKIFNQVVAAAKANASAQPAWVRAIDKAAAELLHPFTYWAFADGVLTIQSTTSGKLYRVSEACACEAFNSGKPCRHRAARRLMQRYVEALGAMDAPAPAPVAQVAVMPQVATDAPPLVATPATVSISHTVGDALAVLTAQCDGAATRDGHGFNKFDRDFGHKMARIPEHCWTNRQAAAVAKMLGKYRKQLATHGIDCTSLISSSPPHSTTYFNRTPQRLAL